MKYMGWSSPVANQAIEEGRSPKEVCGMDKACAKDIKTGWWLIRYSGQKGTKVMFLI